jgi:hypothetical protein
MTEEPQQGLTEVRKLRDQVGSRERLTEVDSVQLKQLVTITRKTQCDRKAEMDKLPRVGYGGRCASRAFGAN